MNKLKVGICGYGGLGHVHAAIVQQTYGKLVALTMTRVGGYAGWASDNWFNDHTRSGDGG